MSNQGNKSPYPLQYTYVPTAGGVPTIPQPVPTYLPGSPYATTYQLVPSYGYCYRYGIPGQEALQAAPSPYTTASNPTIPQQTMFVHGGYDAGARFDGLSGQVMPPPPPGYAANASQMAALQGQNVILAQRKADYLSGGTGGGYTWY